MKEIEQMIKEAAKNESEYLSDYEDKDMYVKAFIEGAKWMEEKEEKLTNLLFTSETQEQLLREFEGEN